VRAGAGVRARASCDATQAQKVRQKGSTEFALQRNTINLFLQSLIQQFLDKNLYKNLKKFCPAKKVSKHNREVELVQASLCYFIGGPYSSIHHVI